MGSGKKAIDKNRLIKNGGKLPKYDGSEETPKQPIKEEEIVNAVPFMQLFRFATALDYFLLLFATLCAIGHGAAWPCMIIVLGDTMQAFIDQNKFENFLDKIPEVLDALGLDRDYVYTHLDEFLPYCPNVSALVNGTLDCDEFDLEETVFDQMKDQALQYSFLGAGVLVTSMAQLYLFIWTSDRQILKMRLQFYRTILKQEMSWFDSHTPGTITVKITDDISKIHDAIGDKTGSAIQWFSAFAAGAFICFYYGWELTLVMLSSAPIVFITTAINASMFANMTAKERVAYGRAGAVAEEVFSSIRTVTAFGGQEKEANRYSKCLEKAKEYGVKKSTILGVGQGTAWFIVFCCLALGFYYGGKLVRDDEYEERDMLIVFFTVLIACTSLGMAAPALSTIKTGCGAGYSVFQILDKASKLDSSSTEGMKPASLSGYIRFHNVHFRYPSRPEVKVLDGLDLTVMTGQTVALVGSSGCGKSTAMQLLLRFYDVDGGKVTVDDHDVRDLNIKWLRQKIGLVCQEPVLFPTTIAENIRYGKEGVSMEDIIQASKDANAYDFIMKMPDTFDTHVGERGAQLSGGQKQRIAIARALISDPKILLLDEATSALDSKSESIVQDALDKASQGRSTIVIAHRLSTIRNADVIMTLNEGKVVEKGSHDELMALKGDYYNFVTVQMKKQKKSVSEDGDEEDEELCDVISPGARSMSLERAKSVQEEPEESLEGAKYVNRGTFLRLFKMNKGEWSHMATGAGGSLANGTIQTAWGLILAKVLEALSKDSKDDREDAMNTLTYYSLGLAVISFITYFFQEYSFGKSGEALTKKMREKAFKSMIRQDIAWHDDVNNQTGALGSQLATEASLVQGAVKTVLGSSLLSAGNIGTGTAVGFIYSWQLCLLSLAFAPFLVVTGLLNVKYLGGAANEQKAAMEEASKSSMASIDNIRTVASLTKEEEFYQEFSRTLSEPYKGNKKTSLISSVTYAITQSAYYFVFAASFYYGSRLLKNGDAESNDIFKVFNCIILGSIQLGQALSFAPNTSKALQAAGRIFKLSDVTPKVDAYSSSGIIPEEGTFKASIRFSNARFRYPTREDVTVLDNFDVTVEPGQMLALVGESGCGKSTTVQLLQRFYDTEAGEVYLDKYNIRDLNVQWLRSQIGMVSQEPVLFDTSIAENIAYGDNSREVGMDEIIEAARSANIHNFIEALPEGYDTNVGNKGTQLSGGQKQRVAIARALIRNPKILLLDEATSALDTESEKIVQEALDKAREGRTCITIAHRLSTIKNADIIAVLKGGRVIEIGSHSQLMALKSNYFNLQAAQTS